MLNNSLDSLDDYFCKEYVEPFLAELMKERVYVVVIETIRSRERQEMLYAAGKSKVTFGYHCSKQAIDLAPVGRYEDGDVCDIDWSTTNQQWKKMGEIGKEFGLVWGGDWVNFPDYSHFQEPGPLKLEEPTLNEKELNALYEPFKPITKEDLKRLLDTPLSSVVGGVR